MLSELTNTIPHAKAIAQLLHPYAEVVIHDIEKNKIAAIFNSFSKRKVGDNSLLDKEEELIENTDVLGPYEKINWDGTRLKSISSIIRNSKDKIIGLLCINLNISSLEKIQSLIESFIGKTSVTSQLDILFKDDWRERVNQYIHHYLAHHKLNMTTLTSKHKKQLIAHLYKKGAFEGKNTANYVAQILNISRATVYNYLQTTNYHKTITG